MSKGDVLREEIERVINCHSAENGSNTPDFILAGFLVGCLEMFDAAVNGREQWFGRNKKPIEIILSPEDKQ